jgi:CxxC-x17-CxxC domain-containing protein
MSMHQGNWKCSTCGGAITELPFEPRSESGLTCRACYGKSKDAGQSSASASEEAVSEGEAGAGEQPMPDDLEYGAAGEQPQAPEFQEAPMAADKPKHTGEWKCAGCGAAITSLPFEPRSTENLKCLECFKKSKA